MATHLVGFFCFGSIYLFFGGKSRHSIAIIVIIAIIITIAIIIGIIWNLHFRH